MSLGRKAVLNTGAKIPLLGFGTWQSEPGQVGSAVFEALRAGYRHLDLAKVYGNQREVAQGIKRAFAEVPGLKREDLFITSKLWNTQHRPQHVKAALDDCLAELELEYLDLYLMHFPVSFDEAAHPHTNLFPLEESGDVKIDDSTSIIETWKSMAELSKSKARAIGVSNFGVGHIEAIINASRTIPAANQVERHPLLPQQDLITYCQSKGIHVTAYSAFGNNMFGKPLLIANPEIQRIAERVGASPAQVILAWAQTGGHSVIPKSVTPSRIVANFGDIELSEDDVQAINKLGQHPVRYNIPYIANKPRWNVDMFGTIEEKTAHHHVIV